MYLAVFVSLLAMAVYGCQIVQVEGGDYGHYCSFHHRNRMLSLLCTGNDPCCPFLSRSEEEEEEQRRGRGEAGRVYSLWYRMLVLLRCAVVHARKLVDGQ